MCFQLKIDDLSIDNLQLEDGDHFGYYDNQAADADLERNMTRSMQAG